jgi:hypothetical protein
MRVAARQQQVAQCGRQDGGVSPALPALHAAFSSTATLFTCACTAVGALAVSFAKLQLQ